MKSRNVLCRCILIVCVQFFAVRVLVAENISHSTIVRDDIKNADGVTLCIGEEMQSRDRSGNRTWFKSVPAAYGAFAAALVALIGNCLVSVFKSGQDYKMAYRSRLSEFDATIGAAMYQLLACCSMYGIKLAQDMEVLTGEKQKSDFVESLNK